MLSHKDIQMYSEMAVISFIHLFINGGAENDAAAALRWRANC